MTEDMTWFYKRLSPDEQVSLLGDPHQALSGKLAERLMDDPGIGGTWWVDNSDPVHWALSGPARHKLSAVRRQLSDWWENRLTGEQRDYILANRAGELGNEYADVVQGALSGPDAVVVVRDEKNDRNFQLPPVVRAFVEMESCG